MKVKELNEFLSVFAEDDEVEIEVYETGTGKYIDTTAAIVFSDIRETLGPVLQIDVAANKLREFH